MTQIPEIIFDTIIHNHKHFGLITLNRPKTLNATNLKMIIALHNQLKEWQMNSSINAVIINSSSEKSFCAGGDIREIYEQKQKNNQALIDFFWHEYRLNYYIAHYPKPYIALLNGITMGGGVGISFHGKYRIATESLLFAMPETSIGFFPDIGSCYLLSRCPGQIGIYLGLTGARLNAADTHYLGLSNYYMKSADLNNLITTLADNNSNSIHDILLSITTSPPSAKLSHPIKLINECFCFNTVEEIITALTKHSNPWCRETAKSLLTKSPTSLKITLEQLKRAAKLSLADCLIMDYRIANHLLNKYDFYEGVRALIIDKDNQPNWQPAKLTAIAATDINAYFEPLAEQDELSFD